MDGGHICFRDRLKGVYEGELLEAVYWYHGNEDLSCFAQPFSQLAGFFGGDFDGQAFSLTVKTGEFQKGLYQFFQLAAVISVLGQSIALPKIRY